MESIKNYSQCLAHRALLGMSLLQPGEPDLPYGSSGWSMSMSNPEIRVYQGIKFGV